MARSLKVFTKYFYQNQVEIQNTMIKVKIVVYLYKI